jgi:3-hydroxybutyryl-CoA dehydrogenase
MDITHTSVLGAGVIGASWAALFLASGRSVAAYDPAEGAEARLRAYVETAWPVLEELGMTARGRPDALTFHAKPGDAVAGAGFIQESVPKRLHIKHALFAEVEPALEAGAVLSSSASGLTLSQMQAGWQDPAPLILGHPFNPPHLIPLVELAANDRTRPGALELAEAFYADCGKVTIRVNKEINGHVANRLQAALWREAIHLVMEGVASVGDVDKAIAAGPGIRWAALGPNAVWDLAAGPGGMAGYIAHFQDTFNGWWDEMGQPYLNDEVRDVIVRGLAEANGGASQEELCAVRDARVTAILKGLRGAP